MITNLPEFYLRYPIPEKYQEDMDALINKNEKLYTQQRFSSEDCFKSLLILYKWIDAMTYQNMSEHFDAEPGDIFYIKENEQKNIVSEYQNLIDESDLLKLQIIHGVPEKYLELVKINQIGRVRAQILYKNGHKDRIAVKKVSLEKLAAIDKIGMTIAKSIKSQVEKVR